MTQISLGVKFIDQEVESHLLVMLRVQTCVTYAGQQFTKAGIAGKISAQHQGIGKEPDQIFKSFLVPVGNR